VEGDDVRSGHGRLLPQVAMDWRPIPAWRWVLGAVLAVGITASAVTFSLLVVAGEAAPGTDRANARLDAVRTGLAAGGGAAAAVGLLLAFRRQYHQEVSTLLVDRDATERRITELYAKAAEELGSDKAPVRLAGLYALERLAQENPRHRQTAINLVCAYLRLPFEPPARAGKPQRRATRLAGKASGSSVEVGLEQELLVRLAAQKIISDHLFTYEQDVKWPRESAPTASSFWPGLEIDLSGAVLLDFTMQGKVEVATFTGTRFIGGANFAHAEFDGHAYFDNSRFEGGPGHFYGAWFGLRAVFSQADFGDKQAVFDGATFVGMTFFGEAKFKGGVSFGNARALVNFNTNWGSTRDWPPGWAERPISASKEIASIGRWVRAVQDDKEIDRWNLVHRPVTS
jgi:Pentapeptide repeats (9 copies)